MRALVLIGHGSSIDAGARASVCACVRAIKARGEYDEVLCGMWKMDPPIATVLDRCPSSDITVVPYFMSNGYYTREVIPRELGLDGPVTHRAGRTIRYANPVGEHPDIARIIVDRAWEAVPNKQATLVVLGHGTRRSSDSEKTIYKQAQQAAALGVYEQVLTAFIDQEPDIRDVFTATAASAIVVVPLFAAEGWHVSTTIPEDLNLSNGMVERDGRTLWYTAAVGSHSGMVRLVLDMAAEAESQPR